ncbi:MAG: bifunctional nuclease family protein [Planctomycetes bacterium]|nr:bifunctional nuclease family protein [Planctomycetota bacterium]
MELCKIILAESREEQIIVLQELEGDRSFPIVIGRMEVQAIRRPFTGEDPPRPMTHDLLTNVITECGGRLERVSIHTLRSNTFFAKLSIRLNGKMVEVDARPSDAIAVAVRLSAPIFVAESVLEEAAKS